MSPPKPQSPPEAPAAHPDPFVPVDEVDEDAPTRTRPPTQVPPGLRRPTAAYQAKRRPTPPPPPPAALSSTRPPPPPPARFTPPTSADSPFDDIPDRTPVVASDVPEFAPPTPPPPVSQHPDGIMPPTPPPSLPLPRVAGRPPLGRAAYPNAPNYGRTVTPPSAAPLPPPAAHPAPSPQAAPVAQAPQTVELGASPFAPAPALARRAGLSPLWLAVLLVGAGALGAKLAQLVTRADMAALTEPADVPAADGSKVPSSSNVAASPPAAQAEQAPAAVRTGTEAK